MRWIGQPVLVRVQWSMSSKTLNKHYEYADHLSKKTNKKKANTLKFIKYMNCNAIKDSMKGKLF